MIFNGQIKFFVQFFLLALIAVFFAACSLQYEQRTDSKDSVPEIVFTNVKFHRYEKNLQKFFLSSSKLEEYKSDGAYFASDANFCTWDEEGAIDTSGNCALLGILPKENIYSLLKEVQIENKSQDIKISASAMQWNSKNEQLIFSKDDEVHFSRNGLELTGTGFSASGVSGRFEFSGPVQGSFSTGDFPEAE